MISQCTGNSRPFQCHHLNMIFVITTLGYDTFYFIIVAMHPTLPCCSRQVSELECTFLASLKQFPTMHHKMNLEIDTQTSKTQCQTANLSEYQSLALSLL